MQRERKRAIFKALIKQYGKQDAYEMYGEFISYRASRCVVCGSEIYSYSEWCDTGFEESGCTNECWNHKTYGLEHILYTKGFNYYGKLTDQVMRSFEQQISTNSIKTKKIKRLTWNKKKSQRKKVKI